MFERGPLVGGASAVAGHQILERPVGRTIRHRPNVARRGERDSRVCGHPDDRAGERSLKKLPAIRPRTI
jgi:hypothetical protein